MAKIYLGTELKFKIEISASGFNIQEHPFEVIVKCGDSTVTRTQTDSENTDMKFDADGNCYMCISTSELGVGKMSAKIIAHVPDDDFDDHYRDEVYRVDLGTVISAD